LGAGAGSKLGPRSQGEHPEAPAAPQQHTPSRPRRLPHRITSVFLGCPPARCPRRRSAPALPARGLHLHHAPIVSFPRSLALPRQRARFPPLIPSFSLALGALGLTFSSTIIYRRADPRNRSPVISPRRRLRSARSRRGQIPHCRYH